MSTFKPSSHADAPRIHSRYTYAIRYHPFPHAECLPTWSSSPQISHLSNSRFEIPDSRLGNSYVHSPTKPDSSWRRKGEAEQADSQSVYCEGITHNGLGKNRPRWYIKT